MRRERSQPLWDEMRVWRQLKRICVPEGSAIVKAIDYSLNQWVGLGGYLLDGDVPISRVEMWRGGRRSGLSVGAPFVWQCPSNLALAPFPHPPRRPERADHPHPAVSRGIKPSRSSRRVRSAAGWGSLRYGSRVVNPSRIFTSPTRHWIFERRRRLPRARRLTWHNPLRSGAEGCIWYEICFQVFSGVWNAPASDHWLNQEPTRMNTQQAFVRSSLGVVVTVALFAIGAVEASVVTVSTSLNPIQAGTDNQGWWSNTTTNNNPTNDNYIAGNPNDNFRSFFSFDLSGISGTVTSAQFDVRRYLQSGTVILGLWDVSTAASTLISTRSNISSPSIFADLGSGTSYGSFTVTTGASADILTFTLNAAALADINAEVGIGYFSIGAALQGPGTIFSNSSDEPGNSGGARNSIQNLVLTVEPAGAVPEPGSFALAGLALLSAGVARRQNRRA